MKSGFMVAMIACTAFGLGLIAAPVCAAQQTASQQTAAAALPPLIQQPAKMSPDSTNSPDPVLTVRSEEVLKSFQPKENEEYTLGAGDEISLDFPGRPELVTDSKQTIGPDGQITLSPNVQIQVAGLTRSEAGEAISKALAKYYTDPSVTVKVDRYSSNKVRVLGYVQKPGEILFEGTPTLLDAISRAGLIAPTTTSKEGVVTNAGNGIPEMCTIYRGNSTAVQVQLRSMLMSGNTLADLRLRRNDIVYVPEPKEIFVSVIGEVMRPGTVPLTPGSTLTSVLSLAGGFTEAAGNSPEIHIIQPSTQKITNVRYKDLMTLAGQSEYKLHPGDVIYINKSGFYKTTYVLQKVAGVATIVSLAAIMGAF
jgi:polysaccharide export outer membrane protein